MWILIVLLCVLNLVVLVLLDSRYRAVQAEIRQLRYMHQTVDEPEPEPDVIVMKAPAPRLAAPDDDLGFHSE